MQQLNASKNTITRWLRELKHYGFIVKVRGAHLGLEGVGKAALYRLTDCPYAGAAPTYDFQNWTGERFKPRPTGGRNWRAQKQNPIPREGTPHPTGRDKQEAAGMTQNTHKRPTGRDKGTANECPKGRDITSFTSSSESKPVREAEVVPLRRRPWSTPVLTEVLGAERDELLKILSRAPASTAKPLLRRAMQ
jgi:hypothetical protein